MPRLHEPAPDFRAHTTHGERSLQDYAGKWLVLFSHPADFTPVCTTEFLAFARHAAEFAEAGCELLGVSVDSVFSHLAWVRDIRERFGVDVPFPIAEDSSRRIASAYGMIHPQASDTSTVRGTFVIDPDGMLRAMIYYPMTTGRSIEEILRLCRALKISAERYVVTPAGWTPGEACLAPPPTTVDGERTKVADGETWYLRSASV